MEQLEAQIGKLEADAQELARDIRGLDADIATWEADHKDATEIRQHENVDFVATHKGMYIRRETRHARRQTAKETSIQRD